MDKCVLYETFVKFGNRWSRRGDVSALSARGAALIRGYVESRRVIKVRPSGSRDKFLVFRFGFTPQLQDGR